MFITQYGSAYTEKGLNTAYRLLRDEADVPGDVEFAHIRDGAYTAAVAGGANVMEAQILAGHRAGVKDYYVRRKPEMVANACAAIERFYFGPVARVKKATAKSQEHKQTAGTRRMKKARG